MPLSSGFHEETGTPGAAFTPFCEDFVDVSWNAIVIPLAVMALLGILPRIFSRLFLISACARTVRLFSGVPWLPSVSYPDRGDGERFSLVTRDGQTLCGSFFPHSGEEGPHKGAVLFCHELNGNRYGVTPYIDSIRQVGFDLYTFDFRGHGESARHEPGENADRDDAPGQESAHGMPMVTTGDLADVRAVIDFIAARAGNDCPIGIFGMGKGAMIALCIAATDKRIISVVLDAPPPEGRLFEKNCWDAMVRSTRSLVATKSPRYMLLFGKAMLYTLACPFRKLHAAWRRRVLGFWCGCRFVNAAPLAKSVRQPVLIVHRHVDSSIRPEQIHAFRHRLRNEPRVWFVPRLAQRQQTATVQEDCCRAVARFLSDQV